MFPSFIWGIFGHAMHLDQLCKRTYLMDYNIDGITPNLPIMNCMCPIDCVGQSIFYGMVQNSYAVPSCGIQTPKGSSV